MFSGPRWEALAARGARRQRLLWASTSVKNPRYRDVMYVEELIGPDTINTMPVETLDGLPRPRPAAAEPGGRPEGGARRRWRSWRRSASRCAQVTDELVADGIQKFQEPFDKLLAVAGDSLDPLSR